MEELDEKEFVQFLRRYRFRTPGPLPGRTKVFLVLRRRSLAVAACVSLILGLALWTLVGRQGLRRTNRGPIVALTPTQPLHLGIAPGQDMGGSSFELCSSPSRETPKLFPILVDDKWGYIDRDGVLRLHATYDQAFTFSEGLAFVRIADKWGAIREDGSYAIDPGIRQDGGVFQENIAFLKSGNRETAIDTDGKMLFRVPRDINVWGFCDGLALARRDGQYGYIDTAGQIAIPLQFDDTRGFQEGFAFARTGGKYGYIDKSGKFAIEPRFDGADFFSEGVAAAKMNGKWGYIDRSGEFVIPPQFTSASQFSEELALVSRGEAPPVYIDHEGVVQIEGRYHWAGSFHEGVAPVEIDGLWGFINRSGDLVIKPQFSWVGSFEGDVAPFFAPTDYSGHRGWVDKSGRILWSPLNK
jgi:hypothetical protein